MVTYIIGALLILMAVFLVISVLMQSSKDHRLGASVAGGAETFFGKTKGKSMDAMFNKLTTVVAIIFVVLVVILYVVQPEPCQFCGLTDHEAATLEECPTYVAEIEKEAADEAASAADLEEVEEAASDANLEENVAETEEAPAETEAEAEVEEVPVEAEEAPVEAEAPAGAEDALFEG